MINLVKYLKGCTTIGELERMSNRMIHTIYKSYVNYLKDPEQQKSAAAEEVLEKLGG